MISYFPTWKPSKEEYESTAIDHILELTSESVDWDPQQETRFEEQEAAMLNSDGTIKERRPAWNTKRVISSLNTFRQLDAPEFEFHTALSNHVYVQYRSAAVVSTSKKGNAVDAKTLAKH